jgi:hypothetical protein
MLQGQTLPTEAASRHPTRYRVVVTLSTIKAPNGTMDANARSHYRPERVTFKSLKGP